MGRWAVFNILQNLFTNRHLESEIARLAATVADLKAQLEQCQSEKEQLAKQLEVAQERIEKLKSPRQTKTDSDYDPFKR